MFLEKKKVHDLFSVYSFDCSCYVICIVICFVLVYCVTIMSGKVFWIYVLFFMSLIFHLNCKVSKAVLCKCECVYRALKAGGGKKLWVAGGPMEVLTERPALRRIKWDRKGLQSEFPETFYSKITCMMTSQKQKITLT